MVFHGSRVVFAWFSMVPGGFLMVFHGSRLFFMFFYDSRLVFHGSRSIYWSFMVLR